MADRTHSNGIPNGLTNGVHNETVNGAAGGLANGVEDPSKRGFIGAIDQGTTSTRFIIFEVATGEPVAKHQLEIENHHPHPGWHEHDPKELLHSVTTCMEAAFADFVELGHTKDDLKAIGITNQRETTVVWDGRTGETLHNAIVWSDTRTADKARQINEQATSKTISDLTGLPVSTYPSAIKLSWLLNNVDEVRQVWEDGHLMFGTVDTWLVYCLNGGSKAKEPVHVTDSTNASRTMLMNLRTLHWEDSIIQTFGLDRHPLRLPRIVSSSDPNAFGSIFSGPLEGVRITGCLGDQSAALVGQCAFAPGQAKNTYGTGCFLLYNVGKERPDLRGSGSGLISTVAYDFATTGEFRQATYALEGSIATAGSGVKFLVKNLGLGNDAHDINALANSVPDSGGVVFVTAFSGLLAPYWIDDARGTLFGLTQFTQKGHIARATLDATCYQAKAILDAMAKQSGSHLNSLAVDGGLSNSDLCMQSQADISGIPIDRPAMHEITALGAAYAAGLGIGAWTMDELIAMNARQQGTRRFEPNSEKKAECERMYRKWGQAVHMSRGWATDEDATASSNDEQSASSSEEEDAPFDLEHMN
ncbi:Glycerol kinase like protein [Verticillium longisporum]|uniref:glycerol kinase n=1 Tax=Verticillium longisporum TaxID=100787 RepID=A0A8I2ZFQ3_VERLO|nr:Glycerol kinase like protein [Verticillium longisporum]KAG7130188.1 Glycerol kinase like protein [Verticillium longisporum]